MRQGNLGIAHTTPLGSHALPSLSMSKPHFSLPLSFFLSFLLFLSFSFSPSPHPNPLFDILIPFLLFGSKKGKKANAHHIHTFITPPLSITTYHSCCHKIKVCEDYYLLHFQVTFCLLPLLLHLPLPDRCLSLRHSLQDDRHSYRHVPSVLLNADNMDILTRTAGFRSQPPGLFRQSSLSIINIQVANQPGTEAETGIR